MAGSELITVWQLLSVITEAEIDGKRYKVWNFAMRSMASGRALRRAYFHATQQAFLEAHELGFGHFVGVYRRLRYYNLKSPEKKIMCSHQREETEQLIVFRSIRDFRRRSNPARWNERGGGDGYSQCLRFCPRGTQCAMVSRVLFDERETTAGYPRLIQIWCGRDRSRRNQFVFQRDTIPKPSA
jgi:hypothetical protein